MLGGWRHAQKSLRRQFIERLLLLAFTRLPMDGKLLSAQLGESAQSHLFLHPRLTRRRDPLARLRNDAALQHNGMLQTLLKALVVGHEDGIELRGLSRGPALRGLAGIGLELIELTLGVLLTLESTCRGLVCLLALALRHFNGKVQSGGQ